MWFDKQIQSNPIIVSKSNIDVILKWKPSRELPFLGSRGICCRYESRWSTLHGAGVYCTSLATNVRQLSEKRRVGDWKGGRNGMWFLFIGFYLGSLLLTIFSLRAVSLIVLHLGLLERERLWPQRHRWVKVTITILKQLMIKLGLKWTWTIIGTCRNFIATRQIRNLLQRCIASFVYGRIGKIKSRREMF